MKPFSLPSRAVLFLSICLFACSDAARDATSSGAGVALPSLSEGASVDAVADHLMAAQDARVATTALARTHPDLDRETAYQILVETLDRRLDGGARVRGWKLGGTRVTDPTASPDPIFGYSLDAHVYPVDRPLPASDFVGGRPEVEAEIAILIGTDLPGPTVTREQLMAAIRGVSGAIEVLSRRLAPYPADDPASLTPNHAIADNVYHGGVILGHVVLPADSLDFDAETAVMRVNGEEVARGSAADIMGTSGTAIDGVLWLANELPKHGLFLKSGDYVVTGSVYTNPTVEPGDQAALEFSTLGTIAFTVGP